MHDGHLWCARSTQTGVRQTVGPRRRSALIDEDQRPRFLVRGRNTTVRKAHDTPAQSTSGNSGEHSMTRVAATQPPPDRRRRDSPGNTVPRCPRCHGLCWRISLALGPFCGKRRAGSGPLPTTPLTMTWVGAVRLGARDSGRCRNHRRDDDDFQGGPRTFSLARWTKTAPESAFSDDQSSCTTCCAVSPGRSPSCWIWTPSARCRRAGSRPTTRQRQRRRRVAGAGDEARLELAP